MYKPIEDYGIIGDMKTVALVGVDGSIDFFCYPDFDSPSVFAALLDEKKGGFFRIAPDFEDARHSQLYVPDSNILLTRFMSHEGILEITDFMPISPTLQKSSKIIRMVRAVRGEIAVTLDCNPAFEYGCQDHRFRLENENRTAFFIAPPDGERRMHLISSIPLESDLEGTHIKSQFTLKHGEEAFFVLNCSEKQEKFSRKQVEKLHNETLAYWQDWSAKITYRGRWRDIVNRSALVLKLLTSRRHGSIVAAPTFGLPEAIGGSRNWDYRYCWIRDSAFTTYSFIRLGLKEEAIAFIKWVEQLYLDSKSGDGMLQLMYRMDGSEDLEEIELENFEGYKKSSPVRVGNDAYRQYQLDIYGELLDCIAYANNHITKISHDAWKNLVATVEYVCKNWQKKDAGIWEFRDEQREFLHSRLMCWVSLDRALRLANQEGLPAPVERWQKVRSEIYNDIFENFWNDDLKSFVQHKDTTAMDASVLMMPLTNFIGSHDPRWLSTLEAVEKYLASDALVHRYHVDDIDLEPIDSSSEGSFNACSFWYVACLARSGQLKKAELLFSKLTGYGNHLGLYAEETADNGRQLGNFPQAFTHLAIITAVIALTEAKNLERAPSE